MTTRMTPPEPGRLFAEHELALRPSTAARLRALAASGPARLTVREMRALEDRRTMEMLRTRGEHLAREFALTWSSIDPEAPGVTEHYGICYEDGVIRIRLRHAQTGKLLKESSLVDTLCHELAHLRHMNHGAKFRRLYAQILERARELGYYQPGPEGRRPVQGSLFPDERCGAPIHARRGGIHRS